MNDQLNALAAGQATQDVDDNRTQQPVTEKPEPRQAQSEYVPYDRFQKVIEDRNQLADQVANLSDKFNQILSKQADQHLKEPLPNFETTDQLVSYIDRMTDQKLQAQMQAAYEKEIRPIKEKELQMTYLNGVESYFARNQRAAALRDEMDRYTANLSPIRQQAIVNDVLDGRFDALDEVFYLVSAKNQDKIEGIATKSQQQQVNQAYNPNPYKQQRSVAPSLGDYKSNAIEQARQTGRGDFSPFFQGLFEQTFKQ